MADRQKEKGFTGIGSSTLIIIFVVLAITVFLLFTLFTVRQDLKSAQKNADSHKAYYAADVIVTEKLAELYDAVDDDSIFDIMEYGKELGFEVKSIGGENYSFTLKQDIDKNSSILCTAELKGGRLTVTGYQTINKNSYINEESLPIWDGNTLPLS